MSEFDEWARRQMRRAIDRLDDCPRCGGPIVVMPDDCCWLCGMHPEAEGPAKPPQFMGIRELLS